MPQSEILLGTRGMRTARTQGWVAGLRAAKSRAAQLSGRAMCSAKGSSCCKFRWKRELAELRAAQRRGAAILFSNLPLARVGEAGGSRLAAPGAKRLFIWSKKYEGLRGLVAPCSWGGFRRYKYCYFPYQGKFVGPTKSSHETY